MPRRSLATLLVLIAVVLAAAVLPQTPAGRGWLLERVREAAASAGWQLSWSDSSGNPWRALELEGAEIRGPGLEADLDRARVAWFAPGLLTGDLPLWIEVEGGRIDVDADAFAAGADGGGGGGLPVRPEIRAIDLRDTEVRVGDVPYTVPDVRAEGLRIAGRGSAAEVAGRLVTDEGGLTFDARVATEPLRVTADLEEVDARLGRTWWPGVTGGTASGTARWDEDGLRVDLEVRDGSIEAAGVVVDDIAGNAGLAGGLVTADLSGVALGGPVAATGRVDVSNRTWSASLRGTPRLGPAAARVLPEDLPDELRPEGEALVTAGASGWTDVEVTGNATGSGTLAGRPLAFETEGFRYTRADGLTLRASGRALGGDVSVRSAGPDGDAWEVAARGVSYGPATGVDVDATVGPGGDGTFTAAGALAGFADLTIDGESTDGTLTGFVSGSLRSGGTLEGAASWGGGDVTGAVRVHDAPLAGAPPLTAELAADGPLTSLPLTLRVQGDDPWTPELGPVDVGADLRGSVTAVLEGGILRDVDGQLGPLSLNGHADPAALAGLATGDAAELPSDAVDLTASLAPTPVEAAGVRAIAALEEARIGVAAAAAGLELEGGLRLDRLELPTGTLAPLEGRLQALWTPRADDALSAQFRGADADVVFADGTLELDLREHGVTIAGTEGTASGTATVPLDAPLAGLRGDARLSAGEAGVRVEATAEALAADATLPAGARLFGRTLTEPLDLSLDLPGRTTGRLDATLGDATLAGGVDLEADVPFDGALRTADGEAAAGLDVRVRRDPWRVTADGEAVLDGLAAALGLPVQGRVRAEGVAYGPDGASGDVTATLTAPTEASVRWSDGEVAGTVPTPLGEVVIEGVVSGETRDLTASHPWGSVTLDATGLAGGGTIPARTRAGIDLPELAWSLSGDETLAADELTLSVGDSTLRWTDDGPAADVSLPLGIGDATARVTGTVTMVDGVPRVDLRAALPGDGTATARGPLEGLAVTLDAPAAVLADVAGAPVDLEGEVSITASADALAPSVDGVGSWRAGGEELDLTLVGPPWTAVARGPRVEATITPETVTIDAAGARLGAFVPTLAGLELDGTLERDLAEVARDGLAAPGGWRGELTVQEPTFGSIRLRGEGAELRAEGGLTVQGVDLEVDGRILPDADVNLAGRHEATGLQADVRAVRDAGGEIALEGTLRWPEIATNPLRLPAGEARITGTPGDLRIEGLDGGALTFRGGELGGSASLAVEVRGVPHTLRVRPTGAPNDPSAVAELSGPSVQATARVAGGDAAEAGTPWVEVEAQVRPEAWPAELDAAALGPATVRARLDRAGAWTATVDAEAAPAGEPLALRLDAQGEGAAGTGAWRVTGADVAAEAAPLAAGDASFGPEGTTVTVDVGALDVAALGELAGVEATGAGEGTLTARWRPDATPSLRLSGEARLEGIVAGQPLALDAELEGGRQALRVEALGVEAFAERPSIAADWSLAIAGDALSLTGTLAADLHRADLDGTVGGEPAQLRVARDASGPLLAVATYAGAQATLAVRSAPEGVSATLDASAPAREGLPIAGSLSARLAATDAGVTLRAADVALVAPTTLRADLSGPLWPRADLRGSLAAAAPFDALAITLRGPPDDLQARVSMPGLTLDARLTDGTPARLALSGPGLALDGVEVVPGPDALAWGPDAGWSGSATVAATRDDGAARADLNGTSAGLEARLTASLAAAGATLDAEADATLTGAPWAADLAGEGRVEGRLAAEVDGRPLLLTMPIELTGTLPDPRVLGTPTLAGAIEATGEVRVARTGATASLRGPGVDLAASADAAGWSAEADVDALPLDPWVPALTRPRLDARAELAAAWGETPHGRVRSWSVTARGGEASGTAELNDTVSVTARVDADLARLSGGGAAGTIRGPLSLRAAAGTPLARAAVSGSLSAEGVRVGDVEVQGELALGGALPIPDVIADVTLGGPVEGPLRISWRPTDERLDLTADVAIGAWTADVQVSGGPADLAASGAVTGPAGALVLSAADGAVRASGHGGLEGVEAHLRPFEERAEASLPLGVVADAAGGRAELTLDARADAWLEGLVLDPVVAGTALPDLDLRSEGTTVRASGAGPTGEIDGSLSLTDLGWTVRARDVSLPDGLRADVDGEGRGARGEAAVTLEDAAAPAAANPTDLAARIALAADGFALAADGTFRGGSVAIDLRREAGTWRGPVAVEDLPTPAGRVSLEGVAAGDGPWPQAVVTTRLEGPLDASGTITAAPDAVSVDLDVTLPGGTPATLQGRVWPTPVLGVHGPDGDVFRLEADGWGGGSPWRASGAVTLPLPGAAVTLDAPESTPRLAVAPDALPDARLVATLPAAAPLPAVRRVLGEGLTFTGEGDLTGRLVWDPPLGARVEGLAWRGGWGDLTLDGTVAGGRADLAGRLTVTDAQDEGSLPLLPGLVAAPFGPGPLALRLEGDLDTARLEVVPADAGADAARAELIWSGAERSLAVEVATEPLDVDAALRPGEGLVGEARLQDLPLVLPGFPDARLDGSFVANGTSVTGRGALQGPGRVSIDGTADLRALLPTAYRPEDAAVTPAEATSLSLRLADLDLSTVPWLDERLPGLAGGLSGVVEVRGSRVIGQLTAPELRTGGRAVPLRLEGAGDLGDGGAFTFGGAWAGSPIQGSVDADGAELLLRLERFPIQAPVEALFGPLAVDAEATGVARLNLPFGGGAPDVRIATERVRLERAGVVTSGRLSVEYVGEALHVDADFSGDGRWVASGTIAPDELDFTFEASDADATPLLALVPSLARLGAGAEGDLTVHATGSPQSPLVTVRTDGLELALAGSRYRLTDTEATLEGPDLSVEAAIEGVEPVGGRLRVAGDGRLLLSPWRLEDAAISLGGDLVVPVLGAVQDVQGVIRADAEGRPYLDADARIGAPATVQGTLWPLNLRARGEGLSLRVPALMLASSSADTDLTLRYDDRFRLSGRIAVREGRFALGTRAEARTDARAGPTEDAAPAAADRGPNPALARFSLDDIAVTGRRLSFNENFGSAEFEADLRVGGTAAAPRVSGQAVAQRGTFRFSGREFALESATATFEPSRGAYPLVSVVAVSSFEKREVLGSAAEGVSFEAPSGPTFEVRLAFEAEVLPTPGEARPFRLDLDPVLTSDAVISTTAAAGLTEGARSLTEAELVSLVTVGRLDLAAEIAGGVAGGVAQSALDSAVDLLILSELQSALSEALGLDLVEIRTSTLGSVLNGGDDPFGVSVRLGGYVNEELFASVEISRFGETNRELALANTLSLTYELGPLDFELATSLGFPSELDLTPVPEVSAGLRYELTPLVAIETGATVSTPESEARFGVTLRW